MNKAVGPCIAIAGIFVRTDRGLFDFHYRRNKPIALSGYSLDESRFVGIISEGLPDFSNGAIDAVVGVDKDGLAPNSLHNLIAGDDVSSLLHEEQQNLHWDALQFEHTPTSPQFVGVKVEFEVLCELDGASKPDWPR